MTDHKGEHDANRGSDSRPDRDDLLLDAVADYVRLLEAEAQEESQDQVDLDTFLQRYPSDLRADLQAMCRAHQAVARELNAPGLESSLSGDAAQDSDGHPADARRIGEFAILDELGRGGMGVVYLAEQVGLRRRVALKVLAPTFAFSASHKERFRREAAAAARLNHPGIAPIHAFGEVDGTLYYAMEFVPGRDLAQHIEAARESGKTPRAPLGVLPKAPYPVEIAELVARIADALHEAHEQGIVHRDVKPSNVLLGADGNPRVLDFGLAKSDSDQGMDVSRSGDLTGTPLYMSPEQTLAQRAPVDRRSDVFSLGAVLYELGSGERAFRGETLPDLVFQICFVEPKPLDKAKPPIPRDLATICAKAMEKDPRARYQTAAEFAADLRRFTSFRPVRAKPASLWARSHKWLRRHRMLAALAATAMVLGVLAAAYWHNQQGLADLRFAWLLEQADTSIANGKFAQSESLLRKAALVRPLDAGIKPRYDRIANARETAQRTSELRQLAAERLLTQSALELPRDPELALALAMQGVQRRERHDHDHEPARAGADCASVVAALAACIQATPLPTTDAGLPTAMTFVPGSKHAIAASRRGVSLWDLRGLQTLDFTRVPTQQATQGPFAVAADGKLLGVAEPGGKVSLWRLPELEPAGSVTTNARVIRDLELSTDGTMLAAIIGSGACQMWRLDGDTPERVFGARSRSGAMTMSFAPGRDWLLVQHRDCETWIVRDDGSTALRLAAIAGEPLRRAAAARWLPSGDAIARVAGRDSVSIYELAGEGAPSRTYRCASDIAAIAISADGAVLAAGCDDHTARLWSLDNDRELLLISGHQGAVQHVAVTGSHGVIVTAGEDRVVALHEVATGRLLARMPQPDHVEALEVAPDAGRILCRFRSHEPLLWDLAARRPALTIAAHRTPVRTVAFAPDAQTLATTGEDGWLRTWSVNSGSLQQERRYRGMSIAARWTLFDANGSLRVVASEHLHQLASADLEEQAHVWLRTPQDGRGVRRMRGVRHAAVAPDGKLWFVLAGSACTLKPTGADPNEPPEIDPRIDGGESPIVAAQPLAGGAIAVLRGHGELQLWNVQGESARQTLTVGARFPRLRLLDTNATGDRWAVAGLHGLEVFDQSGSSIAGADVPGDEITALAMCAEGTTVALGHRNGRVTLFDVAANAIRLHWRPHQDRIDALAFSPNGALCASASMDQLVRVWPTDAIAAAKAYGVRALRMAERERFALLDDNDRQAKPRVDDLYAELVLTRDVLSALDAGRVARNATSPEEADNTAPPPGELWHPGALERARAYALERPNPQPETLHQKAAQIVLDPESGHRDLERSLALARAASRIRPDNANDRVMLSLALFRLDQPAAALDALDVAFGLSLPPPTQPLAWAVRALCHDALGRDRDAKQARQRLSEVLRARQSPGPRRGRGGAPPRSETPQPGMRPPGARPQGTPQRRRPVRGPANGTGPRPLPMPSGQATDRSRFPWQAADDRHWIDRAAAGGR